jgi:hypothetical protein
MSLEWLPAETGTHQDHVIAHVVGATVLGHFVFDQAAHLLLDIGFIWTIFADGEMGLVPQSMAIKELEIGQDAKTELLNDAQLLHDGGRDSEGLVRMRPAPVNCLITEVSFYAREDHERRVLISGEEGSLAINTSLLTGEVHIEATDIEREGT